MQCCSHFLKGIKTHGLSAAKEDMWHTSVLFTGTAKSPFSTPHISITTGQISIKVKYFMPCIYTTLHAKFEENRFSNLRDTVQLISKMTLVCGNTHAFLYFCHVTRTKLTCDMRVIFRVEHASSISCAA